MKNSLTDALKIRLLSQHGYVARIKPEIVSDKHLAFKRFVAPFLKLAELQPETFFKDLMCNLDAVRFGGKANHIRDDFPNAGNIVKTETADTRARRDAATDCAAILQECLATFTECHEKIVLCQQKLAFIGHDIFEEDEPFEGRFKDHGKLFDDIDCQIIQRTLPGLKEVEAPLYAVSIFLKEWYNTHHPSGRERDEVYNIAILNIYQQFERLLKVYAVRVYIYQKKLKIQPMSGHSGFFGRDPKAKMTERCKRPVDDVTAAKLTANALTTVGINDVTEKTITNIVNREIARIAKVSK